MNTQAVATHIVTWLRDYCDNAGMEGFVVGISGGVDSALTSTLCALTGKKVLVISMPIRQRREEFDLATKHIADLEQRFDNVESAIIDLTETFTAFEALMPFEVEKEPLTMANTRARLRMTTLYALAQSRRFLVAGTGNKVEDFGVGFFTKYGDGGVDLSPIADLTKSDVWAVGKEVGVIQEILDAPPTDGLWADGRTDEEQIGATYPELEWAMDFKGDESALSDREKEILTIYRAFNTANKHKMLPIPVCKVPEEFKA